MAIMGNVEQARSLYLRSIKSASEHKFIHEQAISSELAGLLFYEVGLRQKACLLLKHSINCYEKWGAHAVARRVENTVREEYGVDLGQLKNMDGSTDTVFTPPVVDGASRKRQPDHVFN